MREPLPPEWHAAATVTKQPKRHEKKEEEGKKNPGRLTKEWQREETHMYTQVSLSAVPLGCARFCLNKDQPSVTVVCSCNLCLGSHYDLAPLITAVFPSSVRNLHTPLSFAGVLFLRKLLDHRQAGFPKYKSQPWAFPAWQHFQEPNQIISNFLVVQITCWTILLHRRNGGQEDLGSHFANEPFTNIFPKKLNFETIVSVWAKVRQFGRATPSSGRGRQTSVRIKVNL